MSDAGLVCSDHRALRSIVARRLDQVSAMIIIVIVIIKRLFEFKQVVGQTAARLPNLRSKTSLIHSNVAQANRASTTTKLF